jgi:type II secretory pathway pseudopilin PulG
MLNNTHRQKCSTRPTVRFGLSLLELLVVLTILIALGGIVVSTLPGMLKRTQVATAASNIPEIDATIRRTAMLSRGKIGNRFDALVAGSDSLDGNIPSYIGGAETFETTNLSVADVGALREIGITELVPAAAETINATYNSHDQTPVEIGSDSNVCSLSDDSANNILTQDWNLEPAENAKYIVIGLGEQCSMVGAGAKAAFSESPVHFSDSREQSPDEMYSRYLLLVEIKSVDELKSVARYVGAGIPGRDGIHSVSKELEDYYTD